MHTVKCAHLISKLQLIETSKREVKTTLSFLPFPMQTLNIPHPFLYAKKNAREKKEEIVECACCHGDVLPSP
jgi:hypothetical protein